MSEEYAKLQYEAGVQPVQDYDYNNNRVAEVILDNDPILIDLIMTLRGEAFDPESRKMIKVSDPIISERATNWVVARIRPYTSKIFSLSYLKDERLREMIYEFERNIASELIDSKKVGITVEHRDFILSLLHHAMTATIYKAEGGETLRKLLEKHQVQETTVKDDNSRGFFRGVKL